MLETEHTVVGSEMGPDQFSHAKPGDIVACANSANRFCQVTDEAIQTSACKEWKRVAASDAEAAGQAQRNQMVVDRATIAAEKFGLDAYNSGCGSSGVIGVACQLYTSLGGANPVSGYEPTTGERVLAGAEAILNSLGLVGAVRAAGLGGSAAESSAVSGANAAANAERGALPAGYREGASAGAAFVETAGLPEGYRRVINNKTGNIEVLAPDGQLYFESSYGLTPKAGGNLSGLVEAEKNIALREQASKITAPIDFDGHIVRAEVKPNGSVVGGHSTVTGDIRVIPGTESAPNAQGVYSARIEVLDPSNSGGYLPKTNNGGFQLCSLRHGLLIGLRWKLTRLTKIVQW